MREIRRKSDYLGMFRDPKGALQRAELVRDIELDLYWRRAAYFWAFSAAVFGGYFALAMAEEPDRNLISVVSCLGSVFSWVWYLANRGGKYWQNNWEHQIDLLEYAIDRPLYKSNLVVLGDTWWHPLEGYPWSVSRLNHLLSLFVTITWLILATSSAIKAGIGFEGELTSVSCIVVLTGLAFFLFPVLARRKPSVEFRKVEVNVRQYEDE